LIKSQLLCQLSYRGNRFYELPEDSGIAAWLSNVPERYRKPRTFGKSEAKKGFSFIRFDWV
jgi:hypothetical protein